MNPAELDLRDIHLPEAPGWWPLAVGWWLLLAVLLVAGLVAWRRWRHWRAERLRRVALAELDAIAARCAQAPQRLPAEVSVWLRRVALSLEPRVDVAGLTGADWLATLQRLSPGASLPQDWERLLIDGPYAAALPASEDDARAVLAACRDWTQKLELSR